MLGRFIKLEVNSGLAWNGLASRWLLIFTTKGWKKILPRVKNCRNGVKRWREIPEGEMGCGIPRQKRNFRSNAETFFSVHDTQERFVQKKSIGGPRAPRCLKILRMSRENILEYTPCFTPPGERQIFYRGRNLAYKQRIPFYFSLPRIRAPRLFEHFSVRESINKSF